MAGSLLLASHALGPLRPVFGDPAAAPTVVVVPSAATEVADGHLIVESLVGPLTAAGYAVAVVDPATDGVDELRSADALAVAGGNPFHLLEVLRQTGADRAISERVAAGIPYAGMSAGAMVAGPTLAPLVGVSPFTPAADATLDGLGLTSVLVLPHHDRPGRADRHRAALRTWGGSTTLVPLTDDETVVAAGSHEAADPVVIHLGPADLRLRPARPADAAAVAAVFRDAARAGWASFLGDGTVAGFEPAVAPWAARIVELSDAGAFLVVEDEAGPVAFAATQAATDPDVAGDPDLGELSLFYAHPAWWGSDLARRLHQRALWRLAAAGHRAALLWTEDRNDRARRFYDRTGWRADGRVRHRRFLDVAITESRHRIDLDQALAVSW